MTKLVVALSLALLSASFASATDIALKDGRLLREAVVVKHDAATVTFRHAAGFTQVEKTKLPDALAAEYPLDPAQAKLEEDKQQREMLARRAEAERLLTLRLQIAAAAPQPVELPADVEPRESTSSPTWMPSWVDTYNTESWRLMRARARHNDRDRDSDSYTDNGRDGNHGRNQHRERERDCTPPTARSARSTPITPDVHMTPDFTTVRFAPAPSAEVASDDDMPRWGQLPRRF